MKDKVFVWMCRCNAVLASFSAGLLLFLKHGSDAPTLLTRGGEVARCREAAAMWRRFAAMGSVPKAHH